MAIQEKAKASPTCSRCNDPAISHCSTCEMFLCKKCSETHESWPANNNHNVLSVEEIQNPESQSKIRKKLYCSEHKGEVLKYFCETCKELCCIDCVFLNHQKPKHSCEAVSKMVQKQKHWTQAVEQLMRNYLKERKR